MITKGIITKLPEPGTNIFEVRLPILEKSGINHTDQSSAQSRLTSSVLSATLCYMPGMYHGFNVGDVVFVGFEDNKIRPIILGKLYTGFDDEDNNQICTANMDVKSTARLPENTAIADVTYNDLYYLKNEFERIKEIVDGLVSEESGD